MTRTEPTTFIKLERAIAALQSLRLSMLVLLDNCGQGVLLNDAELRNLLSTINVGLENTP